MTNSISNYTSLRDRAILEYVGEKREEFHAELKKVLAMAIPSTYDNPLGKFPEELDAQLAVLSATFTDNLRTRAANALDTHMYSSMLEWLRKKKV